MDFKDKIIQLSEKIEKQQSSVKTEEATKNAFILPMISSLGYDVFDPQEVVPEMDCDLTKKGDKIDYAIMSNRMPILLFECKQCNVNLDLHSTQLSKYYAASNARFGILTNGIKYMFFADLDKKNIMDGKPFLVVDMLDLSEQSIEQLKKFHKSYFNENTILSTAQELKHTTNIKYILESEFDSPSYEFVSFFAKKTYQYNFTKQAYERFAPLVKRCINNVINDIIQDRLRLATEQEEQISSITSDGNKDENKPEENGVITTQDEIDGYNIVKSILSKKVNADKIIFKDLKSYSVVSLEKHPYWICRFSFGKRVKCIGFPNEDYKSREWFQLKSLDELFNLSERIEKAFEVANRHRERYKQ